MIEKTFHEIEHEAWSQRASDYDALFASVSTQAIDDILDSLGTLTRKRHLDVACGTGHLVAAASQRGAISEGIDFAQAMVDVARTTHPQEHFQIANATQLPYDDCSFDAVTCAFGLSHMEHPQAAVNEAFRVLKAGGRFAFTLWFGPEDGNELNKMVQEALTALATTSFALPKEWTQLRIADKQACGAITGQAGFGTPVFKRLPIVWHTNSAQQVVDTIDKLSVRTKMIIDRQPLPIQRQIHDHILSEVESRRANGVISLAWPALLTVVQKPQYRENLMPRPCESKHTVFDSAEQMLAPETLSDLLSKPVTRVDCQPMNEHSGLAGGQLSYVETNAGRLVLKRMSIASDWIMFASADEQCRSVTLWQYGLLDRLYPHLEHKIIACSRDDDGWAILMHDLTGYVFAWDRPMAPELVPAFLDALARLHATFWNDPSLNDPLIGLCDSAQLLDQTSLPMAQKHKNLSMGVIPEWVRGGWEVMEELLDSDTFTHMKSLIEDPQLLFGALSRYPYTLLHGDYRAENLAYPDQPAALDWQEAARSLMTIDLAWFAKQGFIQDAMGQVQAISYYRGRLETYLNRRFDDTEWRAMVDLGYLVDALRSTCFPAYWYRHTDDPNDQRRLEMEVKVRNQQVRDAVHWL